jgi:hypothetical protein
MGMNTEAYGGEIGVRWTALLGDMQVRAAVESVDGG